MQISLYSIVFVLFLSICGQIKTAAPGEINNGFWPNPEPALTLMRRDKVPRTLSEKIRIEQEVLKAVRRQSCEMRGRSRFRKGRDTMAQNDNWQASWDDFDEDPPDSMFGDTYSDPPPAYPGDGLEAGNDADDKGE